MTLKEKARVLAGASHWRTHALRACGIESLVLSDGPHGLRKQEGNADHLGIAEVVRQHVFPRPRRSRARSTPISSGVLARLLARRPAGREST